MLLWITIGWPQGLAVVSGLGLSWGPRSLVGLGLGSILLCCTYLARKRVDLPAKLNHRIIIAVLLVAVFMVFSWDFNLVTEQFATIRQMLLVCVVAGAAGYFLLARRRIAFAACILIPGIWSCGRINPIAIGLGPIFQAKPLQEVSRIVREDKRARWAIYGPYTFADMFKAAGAQVFNGTKIIPPLDDLRVLDPTLSSTSVYNRYAHIALVPTQSLTVGFKLDLNDHYSIAIDPSSDLWRRTGIRYVALPFLDKDPSFLKTATMVAALPEVNLWVYQYQWKIDDVGAKEEGNSTGPGLEIDGNS